MSVEYIFKQLDSTEQMHVIRIASKYHIRDGSKNDRDESMGKVDITYYELLNELALMLHTEPMRDRSEYWDGPYGGW